MTDGFHPLPGGHAALFYEQEQQLHESIAGFLEAALRNGEPAVMIARPRTFEAVADRLSLSQSLTVEDVAGRVLFLDAGSMSEEILDNSRLNVRRIESAFAGLVAQIRERTGDGTAWIYGELVDVLCKQGNHAAAIGMERLWNARFSGPHASVLCGYGVDSFDDAASVSRLRAVCQEHTHVIPHGFLENRTADLGTPKTIFIVEDDYSVRRALERLFRLHDLSVRSFSSAEEFLAAVDDHAAGCLVVDAQLTGLSGLDLLRRLAGASWPLPAIVMSGSPNSQIEKEALMLGARAYFRKPLDPAALVAVVTDALSRDARAN